MSLSNLFESYIAGGASSELREEILLLVTKYIAASQRAGPVIKLSAEVWEDPRMAPYESVPTSVLLELDNMRNRKLDKMPVSAGELVFRKKADAWRRWQVIRKYEQSVAEPEKIDERFLRIADAAFNSLETDQLFRSFLIDLSSYVDKWSREDQFLAYFGLAHTRSGFAKLLIRYKVLTIAQIADKIGRDEADVVDLIQMDHSLTKILAEKMGVSEDKVEHRAKRLVKALRIFSENLPYVVELCRAIRGR